MIHLFHPIHRPLIWGAEEWVLSAVEGHESVSLTGKTISEMIHEDKDKLVGKHIYAKFGDTFPLLIKFIDAQRDLSVQVHPSDALAQKYGHPWGKTEMWFVLPSAPGARLYCGWNRPMSAEEYRRRLADDMIVDALQLFTPKAGDCFFIPAGRVHAMGGGCRVCEVQQTSDLTYRIYDYNRLDAQGHPRELHTALAEECLDYSGPGNGTLLSEAPELTGKPENIEGMLVTCDYFTSNVVRVPEQWTRHYEDLDSFVCLICLSGSGKVTTDDGCSQAFGTGDTLLLPATTLTADIEAQNAIFMETFIR